MDKKFKGFHIMFYLALCLIAVLGFTYSYIYTISKVKNNNVTTEFESYEANADVVGINTNNAQKVSTLKTITQDTILTKKTYYTICEHTITEKSVVSQDIAKLTAPEFKEIYNEWDIEKYDSDEIIMARQINSKCPHHYIVKDYKSRVAVYYQNPINGVNLKELTNIPISNLSKVDQMRLREGIVINSNEKLAELLEDLGS